VAGPSVSVCPAIVRVAIIAMGRVAGVALVGRSGAAG
jgi:hypothetical protein